MNNTENIDFDKLKKYFEHLSKVSVIAQIYVNDFEKILKAYSLFSDKKSQFCFLAELNYFMIRELLDLDTSLAIARYLPLDIERNKDKEFINNHPEIYSQILNRSSLTPDEFNYDLTNIFGREQYEYKGSDVTIGPRQNDIVFDCGAFIGETAIWFLNKQVKEIYSFEAFEKNIIAFNENLANYKDKVHLIKSVVTDYEGQMYFKIHRNHGANEVIYNIDKYVAKYGNEDIIQINSTTIDVMSKIHKVAPSFIKMDIEGSEISALKGAQNTIEQYTPTLAICTYHKANDVYEIPLFIHSIHPKYKFYLERFSSLSETVCFASVRE